MSYTKPHDLSRTFYRFLLRNYLISTIDIWNHILYNSGINNKGKDKQMPETIFFGTLYEGIIILMEIRGYETESQDQLIFRKNNERIRFENRSQVAEFALGK